MALAMESLLSESLFPPQFRIDGLKPENVLLLESIEQVSEMLRAASEQGKAVVPTGHGAFLHIGGIPRRYDVALSLQRLNRVVDYQPTDMTVTVEAGLTLTRLQELLGEHGQWLPIDPPVPERATIGGIIAANLSGPMRLSQGTIRDFLIGLRVVQADGTVVKGGGRVVKNVAGYDLPKLYCGSFGTLGIIVEATFKVRPCSEAHTLLSLSYPSPEKAMEMGLRLLGSELQPAFLELTNFNHQKSSHDETQTYHLFTGFAGLIEEIAYQRERVHEVIGSDSVVVEEWQDENERSLMQELRDFPVAQDTALGCKISILPTRVAAFCAAVQEEARSRGFSARLLAHAGNGILYSRFAQGENTTPEKVLSFVDWLRILVKKLHGYMVVETVDSALKERIDVWGHIGATFPLMKRLKETLDPQGILNPGRFVGGI
jgi:glycolate oxidase FAD binding subunit